MNARSEGQRSAPTDEGGARTNAAGIALSLNEYNTVMANCQAAVLAPLVATCGRNLCDARYLALLCDLVALARRWAT